MDEAREYELSLLSSTTQSTEGAVEPNDENRVLTFAELKELIETGNVDKIPNNKIIPERLNVRYLFSFSFPSCINIHLGRSAQRINRSCKKEAMGDSGGCRVLKKPCYLEPHVSKVPKGLYSTNRMQSIYLIIFVLLKVNAGQVENRQTGEYCSLT